MKHHLSRLSRHEFINSDKEDLIKVHTIQNLLAWTTIDERGYISPPSELIENDEFTFKEYSWMRDRMSERIEGFSGDYPVWARLKKMEVKKHLNWTHKSGQKYVYVSALVPKKRMLASLFDMYEAMMMNMPCSIENIPDEIWDNMSNEDISATWNMMFDLSLTNSNFLGSLNDIQLCIDRLYKTEIYKVRMIKNPNHVTSELLYFNPAVLLYKKI